MKRDFGDGLTFALTRLPEVDLYQMDARQIPFEREFVIGAFDVIEHIVEDDAVLRQMFRARCPGGGLLVTAPQHRFLWSSSVEHGMHQRRYSRAELRSKVEQAGFDIERMTSFIPLLFGIGVFLYVFVRYCLEGSVLGFPFLASIIAIFSSAQLFALGVIGEYLARIHFRSIKRPAYVVRTTT